MADKMSNCFICCFCRPFYQIYFCCFQSLRFRKAKIGFDEREKVDWVSDYNSKDRKQRFEHKLKEKKGFEWNSLSVN